MAISIYLANHDVNSLIHGIRSNPKLFLLYFVPSGLYCVYNNLAFVSLVNFDPTTYYILLQLRMVVTGIIYECVFRRRLTSMQWISLILITIGCLIKNASGFSLQTSTSTFSLSNLFSSSIFWIAIQIFCSCFAGVYTEFLVKDTGADVHLMIQNVFMYVDSIICNFVGILIFPSGDAESAMTFFTHPLDTFSRILLDPLVFTVMLNNAVCGIITSLFLKNFNSILKIFASALELVITAVVCWILFGIPIDSFTVIAIFIVSLATYIYSKNPMSSLPPKHSKSVTTNARKWPTSEEVSVEDTKKLLEV